MIFKDTDISLLVPLILFYVGYFVAWSVCILSDRKSNTCVPGDSDIWTNRLCKSGNYLEAQHVVSQPRAVKVMEK